MKKNISMSEVLLTCLEYTKNPTDTEVEKKMSDLRTAVVVRSFLTLPEKQLALANIAMAQDNSFGEDGLSYACVTELALIVHGLLAYTNISINETFVNLRQTGVYDTLMQSGLYEYIYSFCGVDFERLTRMMSQMISFENLFTLVNTLGSLDSESIEELTKVINEFKEQTNTEQMQAIAKIWKDNNPILQTVAEILPQEAVETVMKKITK